MTTPLLLEVAPEIDINPTSFYRGRGRGVGRLRLQTPVIGSRSALAMSVHPTYFYLATRLNSNRKSRLAGRSAPSACCSDHRKCSKLPRQSIPADLTHGDAAITAIRVLFCTVATACSLRCGCVVLAAPCISDD